MVLQDLYVLNTQWGDGEGPDAVTPHNDLLLNDGTGVFTAANESVAGDAVALETEEDVKAVAFDADNDGDLDLFIVTDSNNQLLFNNGAGYFNSAPRGNDATRSRAWSQNAIAFDADGKLVASSSHCA